MARKGYPLLDDKFKGLEVSCGRGKFVLGKLNSGERKMLFHLGFKKYIGGEFDEDYYRDLVDNNIGDDNIEKPDLENDENE